MFDTANLFLSLKIALAALKLMYLDKHKIYFAMPLRTGIQKRVTIKIHKERVQLHHQLLSHIQVTQDRIY